MARIKQAFKKNLLAGLLVTIPAALTYIVLSFVITRLDEAMAPVVIKLFGEAGLQWVEKSYVPGLGFLLLVLMIIFVGLFATNFIGRKIMRTGEKLVKKIPFVRVIYTSIKKVIDTISQTETPTFQKMVLLTYPRPPLKTLGIVCCDTKGEIAQHPKTENDLVNVFVPTSPNPTTGFLLMVPKKELSFLEMSVEDGLKMIISFGMVNPSADKEMLEEGDTAEKKAK